MKDSKFETVKYFPKHVSLLAKDPNIILNELTPSKANLIHAALGIGDEAGEFISAIKKHAMYNKPLDVTNLKEECGDLMWYIQLALTEVGSSIEEVLRENVDKLRIRYPEGSYSDERASIRLDKE